ncbi:MAG: hypothetical protein WCT44_01555 [Candidatus Paceibacterota bacterium]
MALETNNFSKLRRAVRINRDTAEKQKKEEGSWSAYDSPIERFASTFKEVLPPYQKLYDSREPGLQQIAEMFRQYIEQVLQNSGHNIAIELGGPGSALFRSFSEGFFNRTAGICLKDVRKTKEKVIDEMYHHTIVAGDIFDVKTFIRLKHTLNTQKVDLIISRIVAPLYDMRMDSAILDHTIRSWYKLLNENGLIFVQFEGLNEIPPITEPKVKAWAKALSEKCPEVEVQVGKSSLRLHKKPGAPGELPRAKELFSSSSQ